jgi:hypothetical protein
MIKFNLLKNVVISIILILLTSTCLSGCAISYTNELGEQRIIGLVDITIAGVEENQKVAGDSVELTNVGIMFSHNPISTGFGIGYNKETISKIKNDVLILMDEEDENNSKSSGNL